MPTDLETLLHLQEKDKTVLAIQDELDGLRPEKEALDEALAAVEQELEGAGTDLDAASTVRKELENKIEGYRLMQERKRARLEFVRGAKEASALMAELDLARTVMAQEETAWLKSADRVESAELRAANSKVALEQLATEQEPSRKELEDRRKECDERLVFATSERDSAKETVGDELLRRYERVRGGNAPFSLYELHGEACGHCFTHVPKHIQQQLINRNIIDNCQVCGVMLFVTPAVASE